jgi:protein-S-isoprenylcysteine O-methyltransferase Ste14
VLGRFLFRWRGVIGVLAFGVVFWMARPTFGSCLSGIPLLLLGLGTRFWASGYIGIEGRVREIGGQREERGVRKEEGGTPRTRIVTGPYRTLRHPLYIGNFLLVMGMLVALRPVVWLAAVVLVGFVAEYVLIAIAEERDLVSRRSQKLEARSESAEVSGAGRGGGQKGEVRTDWRSPESFRLGRALVEWRTWVATGVAWGLAVVKAMV